MAAAYAALVSVMQIIDQLQHHPHPPIALRKTQVASLTKKVGFLQEFLESYSSHVGYTAEADPLETRIADAAHAAEDTIESHIVDQITNHEEKMISSDSLDEDLEMVIAEMDSIATEIKETMGVHLQHQLHKISMTSSLSSSNSTSSMVGVDDVLLDMMDKLTGGLLDLGITPIVGMAGIGKTAFARDLFRKPLIKEHFDVCAWATISQECNVREIFTQLLLCHVGKNGRKCLSEDELGGMLYKYLWGRKYLIVLDDMWSVEEWDEIGRYFPDNKNGSRIVITTRLSNLASMLTSSNRLEMRLLSEADSWNLLSKTVFGEECSCPFELEEMGKIIARSCKGLPLSIVVIGGCLANSKQTREFWEYIEGNLNSIVNLEDNERCLKILHMSYRQLPIYLKPCFLYMGVFPEDNVIRVSRLIRLWVVEGFLKPVSEKSLEEIAKEYLTDLIGRNLILVHELGSGDKNVKYCKIHDLLRDFCLREAQKERFYNVATPHIERRVVISRTTSKEESVDALQSMSLVRSLIWESDQELPPSLSFRMLRILDSPKSQSIKAAVHSLESMLQLVNSRYLAFTTRVEWGYKFPSSIYRLWNLQTLIVSGIGGITAPAEIWCMPQIRHVVLGGIHLSDPPSGQDGIVVLENLQTLVTIKDFNCSEEVVKRIPNIKKLRISYDGFVGWCLPKNLECLHKLETLGCFCFPKINPPPEFLQSLSFPHSLKKLTLQITHFKHWEHILEKIGALPLLEKLKLYLGVFEGGKWETVEGQFCSLKFLEIRNCRRLKHWMVESSHFPCLERLVLQGLRDLNEIPLGFAEIPTLGVIDLRFCSDSAVISAKRIVEEQEELYGEVSLQVRVMMSKKNQELESLASSNFRVECCE